MKKSQLSIVIAMLAAATAHAGDEVKVYGKANVSLNMMSSETGGVDADQWEVVSNASRLGFKGGHEVSEGLEVIYKIEYEIYFDDGDKGGKTFSQRNIYAGLKGGFGTVIMGRHDTPLKLAQGKIDRFGDMAAGDMKVIAEGEDRLNNVIMYTTPKMNGFSASILLQPGEDAANDNDGLADATSISLNYSNDWVTAALANNSDVDGQDTTRVVADFKLNNSAVGFMYQTAEATVGSADEDTFILSAKHKLGGGWTIKAQYGMTDYSDDSEDTLMAIGVDKKLSDKSKWYAYYGNVDMDMTGGSDNDSSLGLGYEIKF